MVVRRGTFRLAVAAAVAGGGLAAGAASGAVASGAVASVAAAERGTPVPAAESTASPECALPTFGPGSRYHPKLTGLRLTPHVTNPYYPLRPGTLLLYS